MVPVAAAKSGALGGSMTLPPKRGVVCSTFSRLMIKASPFLPIQAARTILSIMSESMVALRTQLRFFSRTMTAMMKWGIFLNPRKTSLT